MKLITICLTLLFLASCGSDDGDNVTAVPGGPGANGGAGGIAQLQAQGILPQNPVASYHCEITNNPNNGFRMEFSDNNTLKVSAGQTYVAGTYAIENNSIKIKVPNYNFNESTTSHEVAKGMLITFKTKSLDCHAVSYKVPKTVDEYFKCPSIKYLPGISWEDNFFTFDNFGTVKWKQNFEMVAANDTRYKTTFGVYLIEGNSFVMFFGSSNQDNGPRVLTGRIIGNDISIDQLEPQKGTCKAQP
jgi:hypothetical protein